MELKALAYSDLQATDGHEMCFNQADVPLQLFRVRRLYQELLHIFKKHKCSCLFDLGDTTDDRSYVPITAIDAVLEGLEPFPDHELNIAIIGNHQQYLRDQSVHVGRMLAKKFTVVATTDAFEFEDTLVVSAAYPASDPATAEWLSKTAYSYSNYERKLLLGHFQAVGCQLATGRAMTGIPTEVIDKYSLALLGHVHKPQQVGRHGFYVGSPFQQNFGEKGEDKRVAIVDLNTLALEWVPLTGFPEYRTVTFPNWLKQMKAEEEHRYKVVLRDNKEAEAFYKHPLMSRVEAIYDFKLDAKDSQQASAQQSFNRDDIMQRWIKQEPPESHGIQSDSTEVFEVGQVLANNGSD